MSNSILKTCFNVKATLLLMRQVYIKSPVFVWEIFPRILGKRPKGILQGWGRIEGMNESQIKFLKDEFFMLSWGAAVGHNGVWKNNPTQKAKDGFRRKIKAFLEKKMNTYAAQEEETDNWPVTEEQHIKNIVELQKESIEQGNRLNFGTCQKLLNMMCKYYWCAGYIKEPPHLPIDRTNLQKAGIKDCNWTQIEDKNEYKRIIDKIRKKAGSQSLAQWEVVKWKRKSYTDE